MRVFGMPDRKTLSAEVKFYHISVLWRWRNPYSRGRTRVISNVLTEKLTVFCGGFALLKVTIENHSTERLQQEYYFFRLPCSVFFFFFCLPANVRSFNNLQKTHPGIWGKVGGGGWPHLNGLPQLPWVTYLHMETGPKVYFIFRPGSTIAVVRLRFERNVSVPLKPLEDAIKHGSLGNLKVDRQLLNLSMSSSNQFTPSQSSRCH